jgi:hypothetical protein
MNQPAQDPDPDVPRFDDVGLLAAGAVVFVLVIIALDAFINGVNP